MSCFQKLSAVVGTIRARKAFHEGLSRKTSFITMQDRPSESGELEK